MNVLDRFAGIAPPQGLQFDLLAAVLRLDQIGNALDRGDELEAIRIMLFHVLQGDLTRLCDHVTPQTWLWAHHVAGDVPGETAWLDYLATEMERIRTQPPRRGLFNRGRHQ